MKLWVDDIRPAPEGYIHCRCVYDAETIIKAYEICAEQNYFPDGKLEVIDLDHDAGDYEAGGGDYIQLLKWLEHTGRNYPIRIHTMNPVGAENMRRIIWRNGWTEVR